MISDGETMEKVRVNPKDLIKKLEFNFNRHKKELANAKKDYLVKAEKLLIDKMNLISKGEIVDLQFNISPPDDHTADYERAIAMLEMSVDETVLLTSRQFAAYVQDDWTWKQSFLFKNSTYR